MCQALTGDQQRCSVLGARTDGANAGHAPTRQRHVSASDSRRGCATHAGKDCRWGHVAGARWLPKGSARGVHVEHAGTPPPAGRVAAQEWPQEGQ
jgi:hypothetical protein